MSSALLRSLLISVATVAITPLAHAEPLPSTTKIEPSLDVVRRQKVLQLTEELTAKSRNLGLIPQIYTQDAVYEDPMVQVNGRDAVVKYFTNINDITPLFEIETHAILADGDQYLSTWTAKVRFSVQGGAFSAGPLTYEGSSLAKFHPGEDKVYFHRDYYDHSAVYGSFPLIGPGFGLLRQLMIGELGKGMTQGKDFKDIDATRK